MTTAATVADWAYSDGVHNAIGRPHDTVHNTEWILLFTAARGESRCWMYMCAWELAMWERHVCVWLCAFWMTWLMLFLVAENLFHPDQVRAIFFLCAPPPDSFVSFYPPNSTVLFPHNGNIKCAPTLTPAESSSNSMAKAQAMYSEWKPPNGAIEEFTMLNREWVSENRKMHTKYIYSLHTIGTNDTTKKEREKQS